MDFVTLLKDKHLKATPQRLTIVEELYTHGHLNIDQLYNALVAKFPSVSLATIYKNINAMSDIFFISEVKIPHQKSVYELTKETHAHLVCSKCASVEDIVLKSSDLIKEVQNHTSFKVENENILLEGLCPKCQ